MNIESLAFYVAVIAFSLRVLAIKRLKTKHPVEWAKLGNPNFAGRGLGDFGSVPLSFFFRGKFFRVDDQLLHLLCIAFDLSAGASIVLLVIVSTKI
jgi:hypothetical protein